MVLMGVIGVSPSASPTSTSCGDDDDGESSSHILHTSMLLSRRMKVVPMILVVYFILSATKNVSGLAPPSRGRLTTTMQFGGGGMMKKGNNNSNPGSGFTKSSFVGSGTSKGSASLGNSSSGLGGGLGAVGAKTSFGGFGGGLGASSKGGLGNSLKGGLGGSKSVGGFSLGGGLSGGGMLKGNVSGSSFGSKASSGVSKSTSGGFSSSSFGFGGGLGATSKGGMGAASNGSLGVGLGGGAGGGGMLKGKTSGSSFGSKSGFSFGGEAGGGLGGARKGTFGSTSSSFGSSSSGLLGGNGMLKGKSVGLKSSTSVGSSTTSSGGFASGGTMQGKSSFGSKSAFGSDSLDSSKNSGGGLFGGILSNLGFNGDKEKSSYSDTSQSGPFSGSSFTSASLGGGSVGGRKTSFDKSAGESRFGSDSASFGSGSNMFGGGNVLKGQQSSFGASTMGRGGGLGSSGLGGGGTTIGVKKSSYGRVGESSFQGANRGSFSGDRNASTGSQSFGAGPDTLSKQYREESSDTSSGNPIANFFGSIFGNAKKDNDGEQRFSPSYDGVSLQNTMDTPAQVSGSDFFSGLKRGILMDTEPNVLMRTDINQGQSSMPGLNSELGSGEKWQLSMAGPSQGLGQRSNSKGTHGEFQRPRFGENSDVSAQFAQESVTGPNADMMRNPGFRPQGNSGKSVGTGPGNPTKWNAERSGVNDIQQLNWGTAKSTDRDRTEFRQTNQSKIPLSANVMMAKKSGPPRPMITTEAKTSIAGDKSYLNELLPSGSTNPQQKQSVGLGSDASRYSFTTTKTQKRTNNTPNYTSQQQPSVLSEILPENFRPSASAVRNNVPSVLGSDASLAPLLRREGASADQQPFGNVQQLSFLSELLPGTQRPHADSSLSSQAALGTSVQQQSSFLSEILPDNFRPSAWATRYSTPTLLGSDASLAPLAQRRDSASIDPQPFGTAFRSSILSYLLPETQRLSAAATRLSEQTILGSDASLSPLSPKSNGLRENTLDVMGTKTSPMLDWFSASKSSPAISFSNDVYSNENSLSAIARSQASPSSRLNDGLTTFSAGLSGSNARGGVTKRSFGRNTGIGTKTATALAMETSGVGETGWYANSLFHGK